MLDIMPATTSSTGSSPVPSSPRLADAGMTMIVVSHEMGSTREVADRVIVMDAGRIMEVGTPTQVFTDPQSERTRQFLSKVLDESAIAQLALMHKQGDGSPRRAEYE